ncbi:TetR/AcrR family transcriptional regulator [Gloeobacter violaceus]|uniref:TetR family transcriptional regulatory protein n=1 Tax=Gloeobacter violaceus (strain ATCC 29082 / PCC 7421) TaxID=251221 RepID=Q7NJ19_GLOVI|nr:TetR/AcrR family transcriptional regulator [Gloeobacter violaceus]BAC89954.1 TetR family transcriptional regulatory protein [Gloeobacter violaceus PCC 7421]
MPHPEPLAAEPTRERALPPHAGRGRAKREQILRGALAVFARHGFAGASMDRLASGARVSKPTLYSHFQSKEGLFVALFEWACAVHLHWEAPEAAVGAEGELQEQMERWLAMALTPEAVFLLQTALSESARFPQLGELYVRTALEPLKSRLLPCLQTDRDPEAAATLLCCALFAFVGFSEILRGQWVAPVQRGEFVDGLADLVSGRAGVGEAAGIATLPVEPEPVPSEDAGADERREQTLRAAMAVFVEHGYTGTSMDMVAAHTGLSKPTLYSHFQDKEGLFSELIARVTIRRSFLLLQPGLFDAPTAVVFARQAEALLAKIDDPEYHAVVRLVLREAVRFPELGRLYTRTVMQPGFRLLGTFLQHCRPRRLPPATLTVLYCTPLIGFVLLHALLGGSRWFPVERERYSACLVRLLTGSAPQAEREAGEGA